jgi:hypothetical protein
LCHAIATYPNFSGSLLNLFKIKIKTNSWEKYDHI